MTGRVWTLEGDIARIEPGDDGDRVRP